MSKLDFYERGPDRPWPNPQLTTAAIVGHTTHETTRLWVRVWKPATYWLILAEQPMLRDELPRVTEQNGKFTAIIRADSGQEFQTDQLYSQKIGYETDLTGVFEVTSLESGKTYFYALFAEEVQSNPWEIPPDKNLRKFRTRSAVSKKVAFGLYSCHMPYTDSGDLVNAQMWENFTRELELFDGDFVIGGGDQVYTDGNSRVSIWKWLKKVKAEMPVDDKECVAIMRSWYRDIYRGYWGMPTVRRLYERFPNYMIWDDHEIKDGWGSYTKKELANELDSIFEWENSKLNLRLANLMFEAAKLTYHEYEHSHNPVTPTGTYDYTFDWGSFPFFVLDMRGQRDFNRKTNDKILGAGQMGRFMAWLSSPAVQDAPAIFIVSPVPVVHVCNFIVNHFDIPLLGTADDLRDEWEHESNWDERNEILDAVFKLSQPTKKPIVFLSGDVHVAAAFKLFRKKTPDAQVFQLTSSGITYAKLSAALKFAVREKGELGDSAKRLKDKPTSFRLLHRVLCQNNFGIVEARNEAGVPIVSWNIYGNTEQPDEVMRLKSVKLE